MQHPSKLILAVILAGTIGLAAIGIVHAQTANTNDTTASPTVNANVTAPTVTTDQATTKAQTREQREQAKLDEMAKLMNITVDQLKTEMNSGKPFYQIAAEHGVTYDQLKAESLVKYKARLDDMVKVGFLTQAEADQFYQQAQSQPMMGGIGFGHGMHGFK